MATTQDIIRKLIVVAEERGMDQLQQRLKKLADAGGDFAKSTEAVATSTDRNDKAMQSAQRSVDRLERRFSPLSKELYDVEKGFKDLARAAEQGVDPAQLNRVADALTKSTGEAKKMEAEMVRLKRFVAEVNQAASPDLEAQDRAKRQVEDLNKARDAGLISGQKYANALNLINTNAQSASKGVGMAASQMANMSYQINDIVSGLAMGQSPFTILTQQGGQVYQILNGPNGVTQGLKDTLMWLGRLMTPARIVGGLLAAAGVTAAISWYKFVEQQKQVDIALKTTAVQLGVTTQEFMRMASVAGSAGGITEKMATDIAKDIASSGKFGIDTILSATRNAKNFATTLGVDVADAGKKFGETFSSLNGILEVNEKKVRFLDGAEIKQIKNLFDQKDAAGAAALAWEKFQKVQVSAADYTTKAGEGWNRLGNAISNASRFLGVYTDKLANQVGKGAEVAGGLLTNPSAEIDRISKGVSRSQPKSPVIVAETEEQVRAAEKAMMGLNETIEQNEAATRKSNAANMEYSEEIRKLALQFGDGTREQINYLNAAKVFETISEKGGEALRKEAEQMKASGQTWDRLVAAANSYNDVRDGPNRRVLSDEEANIEKLNLERDSIDRVTTATKINIESRKGWLEQRGVLQGSTEQEMKANQGAVVMMKQRTVAMEDDAHQMQENIKLSETYGDTREVETQLLQRQLQWRQQNLPLSKAEEDSYRRIIELSVKRANVTSQLTSMYSQFVQPQKDVENGVRALDILLSKGEINVTQYGNAFLDLKIKAESVKGTLEGGLSAGLMKVQRDFGDLSKQVDSFVSSGANSMVSAIADITDGTKSAGDGFRDLAKTVLRSLEEMVIKMMIVAPIAKALQSVIGGGGGFLTSIFGGGAATGSVKMGQVHTGGIVGYGSEVTRYVHPAAFMGAQRYHSGGLVAGEVPAILKRGEEVLTEGDPRHRMNGGTSPTININVNGARGNMEIMDMVSAGVRQGIAGYDNALNRGGLARKMTNARVRGQR